jgi:hypothetical protein
MLTPGEFVVNRKAAQNNLGLLHSINSGSYQYGGIVSYLAKGTKESPEDKAARLKAIKEEKERERKQNIEDRREAEANRKAQIQARKEAAAAERQNAIQAQRNKQALELSRAEGISVQQAQQKLAQQQQPAQPQQRGGGAAVGGIAIAPQVQQAVGMASQAAFDPRSYGDVNKQMVIFGTLLTGVNQTLVQYGTILQQLNGVMGNGVNNNGQGAQGDNGQQGGLAGLANFTQKFDALIQQLQQLNIPPEINMNLVQNKPWDINVNGAEALKTLLEGQLGQMIQTAIDQINNRGKDAQEPQPGQ